MSHNCILSASTVIMAIVNCSQSVSAVPGCTVTIRIGICYWILYSSHLADHITVLPLYIAACRVYYTARTGENSHKAANVENLRVLQGQPCWWVLRCYKSRCRIDKGLRLAFRLNIFIFSCTSSDRIIVTVESFTSNTASQFPVRWGKLDLTQFVNKLNWLFSHDILNSFEFLVLGTSKWTQAPSWNGNEPAIKHRFFFSYTEKLAYMECSYSPWHILVWTSLLRLCLLTLASWYQAQLRQNQGWTQIPLEAPGPEECRWPDLLKLQALCTAHFSVKLC